MATGAGTAGTSPEPAGSEVPVDAGLARPGGLSYLHIPAVDVRAAADFYEAVFGWVIRGRDTDRPGFDDGTGHVSGAWTTDLRVSREAGLLPFVHVRAVDDAIDRVRAGGGEVVSPPTPEGSLTIATFRDPAGNVIGLWQDGPS